MPLKSLRPVLTALVAGVLLAQAVPVRPAAAQGAPPHAWLFGMWAGGIFPASAKMSPAECEKQATFVVTQDEVIHSTLTHQTAIENLIASVRGTPNGTVFLLAPSNTKPDDIGGVADDIGFGCPEDNVLRVVRVGPNQIAFPDCKGFPSPLVRCPQPG
ncbi:hypothetical protein ACELLULO517_23575 [Acidisoma cellulosilytica]|uniref:Uncharacterized protein n=1 Tax=Acidisoma cellulosilyticum TaxID=2802395 RepID=A0A963Z6Z7_9PROT|nr:hypothetical protein [Acidisoma cellulosilyticum]MCB8883250.1 hypothetical protein [Acidisoma cellulosilyticum]